MATSSITKTFWIEDSEVYERFFELQKENTKEVKRPVSNRLQEGKELLKQFSPRSEN